MTDKTQLRQAAEAALAQQPASQAVLTPEETQRQILELRVHQIELEMQNEELRLSRVELEHSRARFFDLYDLAPVGYVTLNKTGQIQQANLTVATLLGAERGKLLGRPLTRYIHQQDQDRYHVYLKQLFKTRETPSIELRMHQAEGPDFWILLIAAAAVEENGVLITRLALSDVSRRKQHELILGARSRLLFFAQTHTLDDLLRATLDEAELLTESSVGFYHFLEEDQSTLTLQAWSSNTLQHMCQAEGAGRHYPVDQAGVWVDCIRERRTVIHNDYAALPHRKGLPQGHATIVREMVVPVLRDDKIVAILGVGNKTSDYTKEDTNAVVWLADLAWDIAQIKRGEEQLKNSLREKESLLKEIHHRVKNNLQIISSLLSLQSSQIDNPAAQTALRDMQHRVRSMALIHEHLYRSDSLASVNLSTYLAQLCQRLFRALVTESDHIQLHLEMTTVYLEIDQAIPCGLLVNELISNAFKHAFPNQRGGEVWVDLQPLPDATGWRLRVADNGVGLPPDFTMDHLTSLGMQLVKDLTRQLGGQFEIGAGPGVEFTLVFPNPLP
ncbi:MAG: histidine kinase dimerization/phosphoacceptor domain -containing protein [Verrucomicrobiota bacterium]